MSKQDLCNRCGGTGRLPPVLDANGAIIEKLCDCPRGLAIRYHMLPSAMLGWTFESYPGNPDAMKIVRNWADNPRGWLLICGTVGTGKTGLAVSAYKALRDRDVAVEFWPLETLLATAKASYNTGDPDPITRLVNPANHAALILDDMGAERETEWATTEIARLIRGRYLLAAAPLLITTNLLPEEIAKMYGMRVLDRIQERAQILVLTGESLRKKRGAIRISVK